MSRRTTLWREALAALGALLALVMLLAGCGGSGEKGAERACNTSSAATQPAVEAPATDPEAQNVARDAAASVDEASIQSSLAHLTGVSPVPLAGGEVTIAERGSEEGRGAAARYMKEAFEAAGVPARNRIRPRR